MLATCSATHSATLLLCYISLETGHDFQQRFGMGATTQHKRTIQCRRCRETSRRSTGDFVDKWVSLNAEDAASHDVRTYGSLTVADLRADEGLCTVTVVKVGLPFSKCFPGTNRLYGHNVRKLRPKLKTHICFVSRLKSAHKSNFVQQDLRVPLQLLAATPVMVMHRLGCSLKSQSNFANFSYPLAKTSWILHHGRLT
jgi:hypothetical protein